MAMPGILGAFANHAFLKDLHDRHLMKLAQGASSFSKKQGDYLTRAGTKSPGLFLLQSGRVEIDIRRSENDHLALQVLGPGDIVGWSWSVPPYQALFDTRVIEDASGILFEGNWLRSQCDVDHELGYFLLRQTITVLTSRAAATRNELLGQGTAAK